MTVATLSQQEALLPGAQHPASGSSGHTLQEGHSGDHVPLLQPKGYLLLQEPGYL